MRPKRSNCKISQRPMRELPLSQSPCHPLGGLVGRTLFFCSFHLLDGHHRGRFPKVTPTPEQIPREHIGPQEQLKSGQQWPKSAKGGNLVGAWCVLGAAWGVLGASSARLGRLWASWAPLGASWSPPWASWAILFSKSSISLGLGFDDFGAERAPKRPQEACEIVLEAIVGHIAPI